MFIIRTLEERRHQGGLTTVTTYYDEVRDVLDEEGGSDEVVDVDAGFFVEALVVALPEVLAAPVGDRAVASWGSTKGLQVRLGMNQAPIPARSLITRPSEDRKVLLYLIGG